MEDFCYYIIFNYIFKYKKKERKVLVLFFLNIKDEIEGGCIFLYKKEVREVVVFLNMKR